MYNCTGGYLGTPISYHHNDYPLGSCHYPIRFINIESQMLNGVEVAVLIPDSLFIDKLQCGCNICAKFFAEICCCIEYGDTRQVYISLDGTTDTIAPLFGHNGIILQMDCLQPFGNGWRKLPYLAVFDPNNMHFCLYEYYKPHKKCCSSMPPMPPPQTQAPNP